MQFAAVSGQELRGLFELETTVAHNLTIDHDVHAIGADAECARVQVLNILAAINSEVGAYQRLAVFTVITLEFGLVPLPLYARRR